MADHLSKAQRSRQMALVGSRNTTPELIVRKLVHSLGYRYRLHVAKLPGCPDLVFPRHRKVIFVHGCFWHQHRCKRGSRLPKSHTDYWQAKLDRNQRRDKQVRRAIAKLGWEVLVIWECETTPTHKFKLTARLMRFLSS